MLSLMEALLGTYPTVDSEDLFRVNLPLGFPKGYMPASCLPTNLQ